MNTLISVSHMMNVMGVMVAVSLLVSLICWAVLGRLLGRVVNLLCDDERPEVKMVSGEFWYRLYVLLILMIPMLTVLIFAPKFEANIAFNLLFSLRAAFFGGVAVLLMLVHLVRRQIVLQQKKQFSAVRVKPVIEGAQSLSEN